MFLTPGGRLPDPRLRELAKLEDTRLMLDIGAGAAQQCLHVPRDDVIARPQNGAATIWPDGLHGPMAVDSGVYIPSNLGLTNAMNFAVILGVTIPDTSQSGTFIRIGGNTSGSYGVGVGIGANDGDHAGNELLALFEGIAWLDNNVTIGTGFHVLTVAFDWSVDNNCNIAYFWVDDIAGGYVLNSGQIFQNPSADIFIGGANRALTNSIIHWVHIVAPVDQSQYSVPNGVILMATELFPPGTYVPWRSTRSYFLAPTVSYTLVGGAGAFTYSGNTAAFATALFGSAGSYAETGGSALFGAGLTAGGVSYTETGGAVAFPVSLLGAAGSYALTGGAALFGTAWTGDSSSYALAGGPAVFRTNTALVGEAEVYAVSGGAVAFAVSFTGSTGSYTGTGGSAAFNVSLPCAAGSYTFTGGDAVFQYGNNATLLGGAGAYALSGGATGFALRAGVTGGDYASSGGAAVFGVAFTAGVGAYSYAGGDVSFAISSGDVVLGAGAGTYALTGADATFSLGLLAGVGSYGWAGGAAAWAANWVGATGHYTLHGGTASFIDSGDRTLSELLLTQSVHFRLPDVAHHVRLLAEQERIQLPNAPKTIRLH